jgi:hypothetical protein
MGAVIVKLKILSKQLITALLILMLIAPTNYSHNPAGMVTSLTNSQGERILSHFTYIHYLDGNISRVVEGMAAFAAESLLNIRNSISPRNWGNSEIQREIQRLNTLLSNIPQ